MAARWYIVHAYSNFEKKVAEDIENKARQKGLEHLFEKILVPTEKVVEVRRGRKVDSERKFFPGYVLVRANLTDEAYHLIKNTPKVTGFLGSDNKPVPIPDFEADRILGQVQEVSSVRRPLSRSRSASRCACRMVRSPPSMAPFRMSTRSVRASRSKSRFSAALRRSSWNTVRSKRSDRRGEQSPTPRGRCRLIAGRVQPNHATAAVTLKVAYGPGNRSE